MSPPPSLVRNPAHRTVRGSRFHRRGAEVTLLVVLLVMLVSAMPTAPRAATDADLQWAQQVLNEKGFDVGRPTGAMTKRTREALTAFQRAAGLPATGDLDRATQLKLMEGRAVPPTLKTLEAPADGTPRRSSGPTAAPPPSPQSAPRAAVRSATNGDLSETAIGAVRRYTPPPAAGPVAPVPQAAPRTAVTVKGTDGAERPATGLYASAPPTNPWRVPGWVHYALYAVVAGTLLFIASLWLLANRRPTRRASDGHSPTLARAPVPTTASTGLAVRRR